MASTQHACRDHLPRRSTASLDANRMKFSPCTRARTMFMINRSGGPGELELSSIYKILELTFMRTRHRYVSKPCSLAHGNPSAVPDPAMCRPPCLPASAGGVSTHVVLAPRTLRRTLGKVCAAQNRLPGEPCSVLCRVSVGRHRPNFAFPTPSTTEPGLHLGVFSALSAWIAWHVPRIQANHVFACTHALSR